MKKACGYICLSIREQNASAYLSKLLEAGVSEDQIFIDTISSTTSDCPSFRQLASNLNSGDTLFVGALGHLGKSSDEVKEHWKLITKDCGCDVVVLDMPLLDTRRDESIKDLVVQLFDESAKIRKSYSRQRQAEGIKKAKEQNVSFGRHAKSRSQRNLKKSLIYMKRNRSPRG